MADTPDPNKWERIEPQSAQLQPPPPASTINPYLRAKVPASLQLQPDQIDQQYTDAVPKIRIMPAPPSAIAGINATAKGVATVVVENTKSGGGLTDVSLTMPADTFTVTEVNNGTKETLTVGKATVAADLFPGGPTPIAGGYVDSTNKNSGTGTPATITLTNTSANYTLFYMLAVNGHPSGASYPAGFSSILTNGNDQFFGFKQVPSPAGLNAATSTFTGGSTWVQSLTAFGGLMTQHAIQTGNSGGPTTTLNSISTTAGYTVTLGFMTTDQTTLPAGGFNVTDSQGNTWQNVSGLDNGVGCVSLWILPNCPGGVINITITSNASNSFYYSLDQWTNNTAVPTPPAQWTWRNLIGADLPTPTTTTLGGVQAVTQVANKVVQYISTAGVPVLTSIDYQTVQAAGSSQTQRPKLNFLAPDNRRGQFTEHVHGYFASDTGDACYPSGK